MRNKQWIKAGLLTATLITLASPALAQRGDDDNGGRRDRGGGEARGGGNGGGGGEARSRPDNTGGDRGQGGWNRQQSAPQAQPAQPSQPAMQAPRAQREFVPRPTPEARGPVPSAPQAAAAPDRNTWSGQGRGNGGAQAGGDRNRGDRDGAPNRGPNAGQNNGNPQWRDRDNRGNDWRGDNGRGGDWRGDNRGNNWQGDRGRGPDFRPPNRPPNARPPIVNRWQGTRPWNNGWRQDRRYDWQYWRNSHRDIFRLPNYYAPYGWSRGYFRFSIGTYLDDLLFGSSYWIDDPYRYRLPPVYGTLRWVRYYDDALLVDIRDGYVVDIIHDVFW